MSIRITCINKAQGNNQDPKSGITHFGWLNDQNNTTGKSTKDSMIQFIEKESYVYVQDAQGNTSKCYVKSRNGVKYVTTVADHNPSVETDNLLSLPECK